MKSKKNGFLLFSVTTHKKACLIYRSFKLQYHQIEPFWHLPIWKVYNFFFDATEETKLILDSSWKVLWDKSFNITIKLFFPIFLSHDKEKPFLNMIIKWSNFLSPPILKYQGKASRNRFNFCSNIKQKTGALSKRTNSLVSLALRCKLVSSR